MKYLVKKGTCDIEGITLWRYGHLRIELMQIENDYFLLPAGLGVVELDHQGAKYIRLLAKNRHNGLLVSVHIRSARDALLGYRKCIRTLGMERRCVSGSDRMTVISRPDHIYKNPEVFITPEEYIKGYSTLEETLVAVEDLSIKLISNLHRSRGPTFVRDVDYFGKVLTKLHHVHGGDEFVAEHLGLMVNSVAGMRSRGRVAENFKARLRELDKGI